MRIRACVAAICFSLAALPHPTAAQDAIAAFQDSLLTLTADQLRGVLLQARGQSSDVEGLVKGGLVALRLFELLGQSADGDVARKSFQEALTRGGRQPWAHYGLGTLLARRPDRQDANGLLQRLVVVDAFAEIFGEDAESKAQQEFRAAVALDSLFVPALTALADLAQRTGDEADLHEARNVLF